VAAAVTAAAVPFLVTVPSALAEEEGTIAALDSAVSAPAAGGAVFTWSAGRRLYQIEPVVAGTQGRVWAYDLDTFELEATSAVLAIPPFFPEVYAVDEEGGRIFAPERAATGGMGGVLVLDAETLEVESRMELPPTQGFVLPGATALRWSPPRSDDDAGKLHVLIQEAAMGAVPGLAPPAGRVFLTQWDPEGGLLGNLDWETPLRLEACRLDRLSDRQNFPFAYTVLRSPKIERPILHVGCYGAGYVGQIVSVRLDAAGRPSSQEAVQTPRPVGFLSDPASERLLVRVLASIQGGEQIWVYDGIRGSFVGVLGISAGKRDAAAGLDEVNGRLYMIAPDLEVPGRAPEDGGLFYADIRRTPVPQAGLRTEFPRSVQTGGGNANSVIAVDTRGPDGGRHLFHRNPDLARLDGFRDTVPVSKDPLPPAYADRTVDVPEENGVTSSTFTGTARGYGARTILVGGAEAAVRNPQQDFSTNIAGELGPCGATDRDVVLGSAGPAEVTENGSDTSAAARVLDDASEADRQAVYQRCNKPNLYPKYIPQNMRDQIDGQLNGAKGQVPENVRRDVDQRQQAATRAAEERVRNQTAQGASACRTPDVPTDESFDGTYEGVIPSEVPIKGGYHSRVECDDGRVEAESRAKPLTSPVPVTVAEAYSTIDAERDPERGMVVKVTSVARGIDLGGGVVIDGVKAVAESWANGRKQPADAPAPTLRCTDDPVRTAGSCLHVALFGVTTPGFSCGTPTQECGDKNVAITRINQALGANGRARLRQPDEFLAPGTQNGFRAGIQKPEYEREADKVLNADVIETVLPALEITRFADADAGRGRQIFQFGGVEATSTYGIQLLPTNAGGAVKILLEDMDDKPLVGGLFELHQDKTGDGVLGLDDVRVGGDACLTGTDGIGACTFDELAPGPYIIHQTAAPAGYAPADDFALRGPLEVRPGDSKLVEIKNLAAIGAIELSLADDAGAPLPGATFEVMSDNGDGVLGAGDRQQTTCTTGADGGCSFDDIPLGAYVIHESASPSGFQTADDIALALTKPGQTAKVSVVNGRQGTEGTPDIAGSEGSPGEDESADVVFEDGPAAPEPIVTTTPLEPDTADSGLVPALRKLASAPGDALRWLVRSPGDALLFAAVWALLAGAGLLVWRRRSLDGLVSGPGPA
jgi:hypothetical protein